MRRWESAKTTCSHSTRNGFDLAAARAITNERDFSANPVCGARGVSVEDSAADAQPQPADEAVSAPCWASPSPSPSGWSLPLR